MQARSVCASVVFHARNLNTRALMAMANNGICLKEQENNLNAVMCLAREGHREGVDLLIKQFHFSIQDAVYHAAFSGHVALVDHLIRLSKQAYLVKYRAIRGYMNAGPDYIQHAETLLNNNPEKKLVGFLQYLMGLEELGHPDDSEAVDAQLEGVIASPHFYTLLSSVMYVAAKRGDIERLSELNALYLEGEVLVDGLDVHFEPAFLSATCDAVLDTSVIRGFVLGSHFDLLDRYLRFFASQNEDIRESIFFNLGMGLVLLGDLEKREKYYADAEKAGEVFVKAFMVGEMMGYCKSYNMPKLNEVVRLLHVLCAPDELKERVFGKILDYYASINDRAAIRFLDVDFLMGIDRRTLSDYFKGCALDEAFYICTTSVCEASRVLFFQAIQRVTNEDLFDLENEKVSELMRLNKINYHMNAYSLTTDQATMLDKFLKPDVYSQICCLLLSPLGPHLSVMVVVIRELICIYLSNNKAIQKFTQVDMDPLAHAALDVTTAKLHAYAGALFARRPDRQLFQPNHTQTQQLWNDECQIRSRV
jgi:hypothetical protein